MSKIDRIIFEQEMKRKAAIHKQKVLEDVFNKAHQLIKHLSDTNCPARGMANYLKLSIEIDRKY